MGTRTHVLLCYHGSDFHSASTPEELQLPFLDIVHKLDTVSAVCGRCVFNLCLARNYKGLRDAFLVTTHISLGSHLGPGH